VAASLRRGLRPLLAALLPLLLAALLAAPARADNKDCMECHGDRDITAEKGGKEVSAWIDLKAFARSVHADLDCTDCHQDLDGVELPHEDDLKPVDCGACHEDQARQYAASIHGQALAHGDTMAPKCSDCHGKHDILGHKDPAAPTQILNVPLLCGKCHHEGSPVSRTHNIPQERIFENYSQSMHGEGLYRKGLIVTAVCTSCHTAHSILPHTDKRSTTNPAHIVATCSQCHAGIERVHRKRIEGKLWESAPHQIPVCIECHSPHKYRRARSLPREERSASCMSCHGKRDLKVVRDGKTVSLYVDEDKRSRSVHGNVPCAACHVQVMLPEAAHFAKRPCETVTKPVDCAACHAEVVRDYRRSRHGSLHAKGDPDAPGCLDCHEKHAVLSHSLPISPTFPRNVPNLCARCHREGEKAAKRIKSDNHAIVSSYLMSIHGKGLIQSGLVVTATCVDCHTAHRELPASDPDSSVNPKHVADTCGRCHNGIEQQFEKSIHWPGNVKTDRKLPTCKDCHSSHNISRTDQDDFRFRMMDQCGRCHQQQSKTFFQTFHGKASLLGSARAAKCYDCHGTHDILPPDDPASTLGRDHVVATCGKCHAGSHRRFTGYLTHATHHDPEKYPWLFWAFWTMTALLVGTLAFATVHTLAWLMRLWLSRAEWQAHKALLAAAPPAKLYRRFDRYQRTMHLLMMLSFFTLAVTGMSLKFSNTGWAQFIRWLLGGAESLGTLHRFGAVVLICVFVAHLVSVRRKKIQSGKSWRQFIAGPDSILFNRRDLKEFIGSMRWFFGLGPRPRYGRYTYWEKFDYFAVFWGVFVIGMTGMILWFPETFTHVVPGWFVNVATIIHSDEALLAVGFIFTVHFFNTHFRPDKFPMDPVIFTGRVSLEELKRDKPAEYERMKAGGQLEGRLVAPIPHGVERGFRIFGFVMLGIGLTLIALIVYAMLFEYT
jgi:cytochrome b subunit of formate dehydrogenase